MDVSTANLKLAWQKFREANPEALTRDAAIQLKVSEAELVATSCGETSTRLDPDFKTMLAKLPKLGKVMALTRSEIMVHEIIGQFNELKLHGDTGLFFRPDIDTRYFLAKWKYAFAVTEQEHASLQFFDQYGTAAHKIYLIEESNIDAFQALIEEYKAADQSTKLDVAQEDTTQTLTKENDIDTEELRLAWSKIRDVHEGNRLIRQHSRDRQTVYRALGEEYARLLDVKSIETALKTLAEQQLPLMLFGMNDCSVQSYSGTINNIVEHGSSFNVIGPNFNLHLKSSELGAVWLVKKPTSNGQVIALDIFDRNGNEVMTMTDNRKRGEAESEEWTALAKSL